MLQRRAVDNQRSVASTGNTPGRLSHVHQGSPQLAWEDLGATLTAYIKDSLGIRLSRFAANYSLGAAKHCRQPNYALRIPRHDGHSRVRVPACCRRSQHGPTRTKFTTTPGFPGGAGCSILPTESLLQNSCRQSHRNVPQERGLCSTSTVRLHNRN